jgi:peptidyl-prolyl cis-trans isomerase D
MVKQFEDAAMKGRPGEIVGPVKTQFGIHVIKIEGKDSRELKIADIHLSVKASNQTKDAAFQNAQDFVYLAKEGKFEKEAEALKLEVKETPSFQKSGMIPGVGLNESISKFSFSKDLGEVSEVYQIPGGYGVFKISEVKKEGVRPFDEVKTMLQPRVLRKKKMALVKDAASSLRSQIGDNGDLATLSSFDPRVIVQLTGSFLPNAGIPNVGREGAFIGTALHSPVGKVSEPVEGNRGYYLIKVLNRTSFDTASFNMQKSILAAQILQERKQRIVGEWLEKIKEKADIEDNRDLFFR